MGKVKVIALDTYERLNIRDAELNRIPKKGEEFEVSEKQFNILNGNNEFKEKFVKKLENENSKKK